jgi:hypothetical protein
VTQQHHHSLHRFTRNSDGTVRIRMKFTPEEANDIERVADGPLIEWLYAIILDFVQDELEFRDRESQEGHNVDSTRTPSPLFRQ